MSETVETKAAQAVQPAKRSRKQTEPAVLKPRRYVGPDCRDLDLQTNKNYLTLPEAAEKAIERAPIMGRLFISAANARDYARAEREIRQQSGSFWAAYQFAAKGGYREKEGENQ